jgi:hypothetical protein
MLVTKATRERPPRLTVMARMMVVLVVTSAAYGAMRLLGVDLETWTFLPVGALVGSVLIELVDRRLARRRGQDRALPSSDA